MFRAIRAAEHLVSRQAPFRTSHDVRQLAWLRHISSRHVFGWVLTMACGCSGPGPSDSKESAEPTDSADTVIDSAIDSAIDTAIDPLADSDGDGWADGDDCAPADPSIHPGVAEVVCDGIDYDCDGQASGLDADADGVRYCQDCDDANAGAAPGLSEICGDQVDNDCDSTSNDCRAVGVHQLSDAGAILSSEAFGEGNGQAVAGVGDINGDGTNDFVVGVPYESASWESGEGAVYVVLGGTTWPASIEDAWARIGSTTSREYLGSYVRGGQDFTGDGVGDILVVGDHLYLLADIATGSSDIADVAIPVGDADAYVTSVFSSGPASGDVTGDDAPDLVFWANHLDLGEFGLEVIAGPVTSVSLGAADRSARLVNDLADGTCWGLGSSGDLNGDGIGDVAVSCDGWDVVEHDEGGGFVVYGPLSGDVDASTAADATFVGESRGAQVGRSLAVAGDLEADGYDDLAVYSTNYDGAGTGTVFVLAGPIAGSIDLATATATLTGEGTLGWCIARAGDVDGDGRGDLLVTDTSASSLAGLAWLQYGPVTGTLPLPAADSTWLGSDSYRAGSGCAGPGDITGDWIPDLLVTSISYEGPDTGQVFVLPGSGL